jgi:hypothetical protein
MSLSGTRQESRGASSSQAAVFALCLGNAIQWYDFALYGAFATIIGPLFFPSEDPATAMLAAFATYGAALIIRPVGALLFGRMADLRGRRAGLIGRTEVTTYFDEIDASVTQCVDQTPESGIVQLLRTQDRASRFHRLDLTEILKQIEWNRARNPDLVSRLSHLGLDLLISEYIHNVRSARRRLHPPRVSSPPGPSWYAASEQSARVGR